MANNKPYSSYLRTIGTASYVQGTNGNPELHCILGENAFCRPLVVKQTKNGAKDSIDLAVFVKGQTEEIRKYFPGIAPMDDGTMAVHLTLWGDDAKKVDAEAVKAEQSGQKRNVRVALVGYLYIDSYTGKNGQPQSSLKMMCQWLASAKARQPKQDQNGGQYAGQQYAAAAPAPQYAGQVPQYNGAVPQYPNQGAAVPPQYPQGAPAAPQYPQGAPAAPQYPHGAPAAPQYPQGAPAAPQYPQGAPAAPQYPQGAPAAPQYPQGAPAAPQYSQGAPAAPQYPNQGAPAAPQYPNQGAGTFALIEDDSELPF